MIPGADLPINRKTHGRSSTRRGNQPSPNPSTWAPRARVLVFLGDQYEPATSREIATALKLSTHTVNGALRALLTDEAVIRVGYRGRLALWVAA